MTTKNTLLNKRFRFRSSIKCEIYINYITVKLMICAAGSIDGINQSYLGYCQAYADACAVVRDKNNAWSLMGSKSLKICSVVFNTDQCPFGHFLNLVPSFKYLLRCPQSQGSFADCELKEKGLPPSAKCLPAGIVNNSSQSIMLQFDTGYLWICYRRWNISHPYSQMILV